jgi:hypothetical protein
MRRPPSPSPAAVAPPPRRRPPGPSAPSPRPLSPPPTAGAPRPAARRAPNVRRRRSIALAILLTVAALVAYGGYVLYDKLAGSDAPTAASGNGFVASTERATGDALEAIAMGLEFRSLRDSYVVRGDIDGMISSVRTERANVESVLATTAGPRADTVRATLQTLDELAIAMTQWRDAVFLLRFGNIDSSQAAIERAVVQLQQHVATWNSLDGS